MNKILKGIERIPVLSAISIVFILGILTENLINIPFFIWCAFCVLLAASALVVRKNGVVFLPVFLSFCFSLGSLHSKNYLRLPYNHIAFLNASDIRLQGVIDTDPAYGARKVSFILKAREIITDRQSYRVQGRVLVNVSARQSFSYGDELILEGRLYKPFAFGGQKNFSYRDYLRNQGIYSILSVKKENKIVVAAGGRGNFFKSLSLGIKHRFRDIFQHYLWPLNSAVLLGIILGERQNIPESIRQAFIQTGTSHIIAISGFNVGIVAFMVLLLLKALGMKRRHRYLLAIPVLVLHMLAVGMMSSVVRATLMAIVVLVGYLLEREAHIINALGLSVLIILGYNPMQIFDVGFQLSFVSVLGIALLSPKIASAAGKIFLKHSPIHFVRVALNLLSVSLSAWLVTFGFVAYYFRIISPATLLANLIIVPLTSLIIILGFSLAVSAMLWPLFAHQIAATTNVTMTVLFKVTSWLSHLPFAYFYL